VWAPHICLFFLFTTISLPALICKVCRLRRRAREGKMGTPHAPAKGCRPLHSRFLAPCVYEKEEDGDTPCPGKGLLPSALPLSHTLCLLFGWLLIE